MTTVQLEKPKVMSDEPLQRIGQTGPERKDPLVHSVYLQAFFVDVELRPFKGRPVVTEIDPADWPYGPEPGCQEEWDEAGE